jgi:hypothetical protein
VRETSLLSPTRRRFAIGFSPHAMDPRHGTVAAFALTLAILFVLAPWVAANWPITGDEPHYLLVTQSLLADGDIHMANNYVSGEWLRFHDAPWLDPHVSARSDGYWYPVHEVALSIILLPGYALAGRLGAIWVLNLVAALVAANTWRLTYELTKHRGAAWFAWAAATLTIPLLPYAYAIYTEIIAALLVVLAARTLVRDEPLSLGHWGALGFCLVALPWLVVRFLPLSLGILVLIVARAVFRKEATALCWLALVLAAALGLLANSTLTGALYGESSAMGASSAGRGSATLAQLIDPLNHLDSLTGWLMDQRMGLLVLAPIYATALAGWLVLWRRDRWKAAVLGLLIAALYASLGFTRFQVRWGISPRYLVAVLPLAGGLVGAAWHALRVPLARGVMLALLAISLLSSALVMHEPMRALHVERADGQLVDLYGERLRLRLGDILPLYLSDLRFKDKGWDDEADSQADLVPRSLPQFQPLLSPAGEIISDEAATSGLATRPLSNEEGPLLAGPALSLPPGAHRLTWRLKAVRVPAGGDGLAKISVVGDGDVVAERTLFLKDLEPVGTYVEVPVDLNLGGRMSVEVELRALPGAKVWADHVLLTSEGVWRARGMAGAWLLAIIAANVIAYVRWRRREGPLSGDGRVDEVRELEEERFYRSLSLTCGALCGIALVWGLYRESLPPTYEAETFLSQTGAVVEDFDASDRSAMMGAVDEHQEGWLAYGPYDHFAPGAYRLLFSLKRGTQASQGQAAVVDITNLDASEIYARREIDASELERGSYRTMTLDFENPGWQKLVFRVYYKAVADLWVDRIEFHPEGGWRLAPR